MVYKGQVDLVIPYILLLIAVIFRGTFSLMNCIEKICNYRHTYGEVAKEMCLIYRRIKFLGENTVTAIRSSLRSISLKELLNDLITARNFHTSIHEYVIERFKNYVQTFERKSYEKIYTLEIIYEMFLTITVFVPLTTEVLLYSGLIPTLSQFFHIVMLLTFLVLLFLIIYARYFLSVCFNNEVFSLKAAKKFAKYSIVVPILAVSLFTTTVLAASFFVDFAISLITIIIIVISIFVIYMEYVSRFWNRFEKEFAEFLSCTGDYLERNLSFTDAVLLCLNVRSKSFVKVMKIICLKNIGLSIVKRFHVLLNNLGSKSVCMLIPIILESLLSLSRVSDVLTHCCYLLSIQINAKKRKLSMMIPYVTATYICFFLYLYVTKLLSSLNSGMTVALLSNIEIYVIILSILVGLFMGVAGEDSLILGLKHSLILLVSSLVCFHYM